jgi:hypothetical protein
MTAETPQAATVTPITSAAVLCTPAKAEAPAASTQQTSSPALTGAPLPAVAMQGRESAHLTLASNRSLALRLQQVAVRTFALALYRIGRVGPAGVAGLLATTAAVIIGVVGLVSIHNATDSLAAQITQLQQHPNAAARIEDGLGKVITTLPTRDQMPEVIGQMLRQAGLAGVTLNTGHYAYSPPKTGRIGRYELEFPLKAEYPNVRDFINRTLNAVPSAGLDKLRIERKAVGDALVNADVRFVVFVRSESVE